MAMVASTSCRCTMVAIWVEWAARPERSDLLVGLCPGFRSGIMTAKTQDQFPNRLLVSGITKDMNIGNLV